MNEHPSIPLLMKLTEERSSALRERDAALERAEKAEARGRILWRALGWAHDAVWDAHSKAEGQSLDDWLNQQSGGDHYTGFRDALDEALATTPEPTEESVKP